ncbi:MAG: SDR family oxidoreductase [Chloroflexi bacterium]|nr:SDR family oxidoreductase [Chloroflexota bacterium]MBV9598986.1 SDR family oxidoreductase [Chloroflexota bacterium]
MTLEGKVVLITGAARGMGRAYVRGFLERGARVIATDRSWAPSGVSSDDVDFHAELADRDDVLAEAMDISIDSHVKRVFDAAMHRFGTVDVVINNAGLRQRDLYPPHGSVTTLETELGDWQAMFETHVFGTLRVIKQFVQPMLAQARGSIVCVGSDGYDGHRPQSREMPYQSAKAGMVTLALYLAHELRESNVAVNVLLPGHTRSTGSDEQESARASMRSRMGQPAYAPRRLKPEHVVPLALFFAQQDAASGVTGQVLKAMEWNQEHLPNTSVDAWTYAGDLVPG